MKFRLRFSDLEMVEFRILCGIKNNKSGSQHWTLWKSLLRFPVGRFTYGMAVQRSVQDSWLIFKNCLIQAQEQSIPVNRKPIKGGRRPASMNRGPHKTLTLKGNI